MLQNIDLFEDDDELKGQKIERLSQEVSKTDQITSELPTSRMKSASYEEPSVTNRGKSQYDSFQAQTEVTLDGVVSPENMHIAET